MHLPALGLPIRPTCSSWLLRGALALGALFAGWAEDARAAEADEPPASPQAAGSDLGLGEAIILGIVEGATEYLPVSSTGHLLVVERLLGIGDEERERRAADAYAIFIQAGAILAVLWLYHERVRLMLGGLAGREPDGLRLLVCLLLAFMPAAILGLLFRGAIKGYLFHPGPIAVAWFVGGVVILLFTRFKVRDHEAQGLELTQLTPRMAILIGLAQAFALWPGISRSLVTIIGGVFLGLRLSAAVEFSFLLGLITLSAATGWEALHEGQEMLGAYGWTGLVAGFVSAFIAAILSVKWMVAYLNWRELYLFGYYRILLAAFTAVLLALGLL